MKYLPLVVYLFLSYTTFSQVTNNEIKYRVNLEMDADWYQSSTNNASVEWDCINKKLTSTCLVYHNDQWFTIVPPKTGDYYVNISNQKCQNLQGVQIVVLEGDPCKVDSYQLRMCVSYTDQSDMFVRIDSLIGGREYMVNIDGFLGDQCEFLIQFSSVSKGIPVQIKALKLMPLKITPSDSIVTLNWKVPDSLIYKISKFSVYRKMDKDKSAFHLQTQPLTRNAYGQTAFEYSLQDTLRKEGQYAYSVYGHSSVNDEMVLLAREHFFYRSKERIANVQQRRAVIPYSSPKTGMLSVKVLDNSNEKLLFTTTRRAVKGKNTLVLDLSEYVDSGVLYYRILIGDQTFQEQLEYKAKKR